MHAPKAERRDDDPGAIFEWAAVHECLGRAVEAITRCRRALELGLDPVHNSLAQIQLASSGRDDGETTEAITVPQGVRPGATVSDAHEAFVASALFYAELSGDDLRVALKAVGKILPLYRGEIDRCADVTADSHEPRLRFRWTEINPSGERSR